MANAQELVFEGAQKKEKGLKLELLYCQTKGLPWKPKLEC